MKKQGDLIYLEQLLQVHDWNFEEGTEKEIKQGKYEQEEIALQMVLLQELGLGAKVNKLLDLYARGK